MLTEKDLIQISQKGITEEEIERQLENFRKGFPYADLKGPATPEKGIRVFSVEEISELVNTWEQQLSKKQIVKFVPASGAATRMFKHLFEFLDQYRDHQDKSPDEFEDKGFNSVYRFLVDLEKFAFYDDLQRSLKSAGLDIGRLMEEKRYDTIIRHLLTAAGLNYGNLPKGMIKFHRYKSFSRTGLGEHLVEGAHYAAGRGKKVYCHFTVSPEHLEGFKELVDVVTPYYEEKYGVHYAVSFSVQKPSTDVIAADLNNEPFRDKKGHIVFRPGGHGALIENLNDIRADIVFIKNIDNVVPDHLKPDTYKFKKVIGGLLIKLTERINGYLTELSSGSISDEKLNEIVDFCSRELEWDMNGLSDTDNQTKTEKLKSMLDRPVRVCGMVKNEGEPGGGPFWVKNHDGSASLQIVETSQINMKDHDQKAMLDSATHFNPVDLVCSMKDFRGKPFDLHRYIDPQTGFISIKSKDGKDLKAQELPGLWNGAMAGWITVFVEVPITTFNPVKTVNDLLRPQHQPES